MYRMIAHNVIKPDQVKTIYRSQTFPRTGYGYVYNLKPELAARVTDAFFSFPWEGSALLEEFKNTEPPQEKFIPITFKEHWGRSYARSIRRSACHMPNNDATTS